MRALKALLVIVVLAAAAAAIGGWMVIRGGISAHGKPTWMEATIARAARHAAIPSRARNAKNPVQVNDAVLTQARRHFADHCAVCHANNGSGQTEIGQSVYPQAPDMRLAGTQKLSDGEIFYIIHNGVRLTAMPAWGAEHDVEDLDSWKLVHFIRHLPQLTPEEEKDMQEFNPRSPAEQDEANDAGDGAHQHSGHHH
jgi:mono/diheme cytochrome c family protein